MENKKQFCSNEKHGETSSTNPEYSFLSFNYLCSGCFINMFCCADGYLAIFLILCSTAKNWPVLNHFLLWGDSSGVSLSSILNAMATAHACWGQSIWNYINSVPPVCLIISILWPVPMSSVKTPTHDSLSVMRSVCLLGLPYSCCLQQGWCGLILKVCSFIQEQERAIYMSGVHMLSVTDLKWKVSSSLVIPASQTKQFYGITGAAKINYLF